jgi:hypothetical protein
MSWTLKKPEENWLLVNLLNLTFLFFIFRMAVPAFKYPFLILYPTLFLFSFIHFRKNNRSGGINLKRFLIDSSFLVILILWYLFAFIFSDKIYLLIFKDLANTIVIISLFFIAILFIKSKEDLVYALKNLVKLIVIVAVIIAFSGYFYLMDTFKWIDVAPTLQNIDNVTFKPHDLDNNFGILPAIFGTISLLWFLTTTKVETHNRILANIVLIILNCSILLSASRRGLSILLIIISLLVLIQFLSLLLKSSLLRQISVSTRSYLCTILIVTLFFAGIMHFTSNNFKNKAISSLGSRNILDTKMKLTTIAIKYALIVKKDLSFQSLYNLLWKPVFDPFDPESSWGTRNHKTIFPLTGKNVEIVPPGAKGYLIDHSTNVSTELSYCDAFSLLTRINAKEEDVYKASVFCYASEDFDGDAIRISVGTDNIIRKEVTGTPVAYYDINSNKGEWRKIEITFTCSTALIPVYISVMKNGEKDFSNLNGYVIFAFPQVEKSLLPQADININKTSLTPSALSLLRFRSYSEDPIRRSIDRFLNEDTTYTDLKHLKVKSIDLNMFRNERVSRWVFAYNIFLKEYNLKEKFLGKGFVHLSWYGKYFLKDKTASDWPHNPFLSILLYSGIAGLLLYCFFLYKVFYYYIKYIREYPLFFIFFLITFFFAFFSSGSPFDPPVFGFFSMLPFFIHSVHHRDKGKIGNDNTLASQL